MSQADLDDITTALLSMTGPEMPNAGEKPLIVERRHPDFHPDGEAGQLIQRYRCYTCHSFNGYGGTLAPDLSYEGSRSKRDWLVQFLQNPPTLRPTLTVRMPRFNMPEHDANVLADYLAANLRKPAVNPAAVDEGVIHAANGRPRASNSSNRSISASRATPSGHREATWDRASTMQATG